MNFNIKVVGWGSAEYGSCLSVPLSSEDLHIHTFLLMNLNLLLGELLVGGRVHFVLSFEVDPQLEADCFLFEGAWDFRVHDASSGSHPLDVPWAYFPSVSFEIFMTDVAFEDVAHCFEASVRVVWKACRKFGLGEVKHEEGIKFGQVLAANDP